MRIAELIVLACLGAPVVWAQTQAHAGDLKGSVLDQAGGAIVGAQITVSDPQRGISRSAVADSEGAYRVPLLEPGAYKVRVEAAGFNTSVTEGVEVRVGETRVLRTVMEVGAISTEITISAEAPVVDTERSQQASSIDLRRMESLPINRRNYLDFALLSPGVVETSDLVDDTDFRVAQTPHSGLSFGGGNGRGNAFTIDGLANYYNSGGVRPSVSQEAVQEFQVNRNSFAAEFGGSVGGAINIVTRSGTNELHGDLFGFLRHREIQARNFFDPGKSAFTRGQYGAAAGGPLKRDRTFLFSAFERLDRHETAFVPILQDRSAFSRLTPSQQQLADVFDRVPQLRDLGTAMRRYLITDNFPDTVRLFNANSGVFPFGEAVNQFSLRFDHHWSARDQMFLRGNLTDSANQNAQFGALIGFNRGRSIAGTDGTLAFGNTRMLGGSWIAETRLMFAYNRLAVTPTDGIGPDITITGFGSFGREIFLPSSGFERHYQVQQHLGYASGRHALKFGVDINPVRDVVRSETFFGGRFLFGEQVPLGALLPMLTGDPNATAAVAGALTAIGQPRLAANLQVPISALQAFNLGLPVLYQQGFGDPNWRVWFKRYAFFAQDSWRAAKRLTLNVGVRYDLESPPQPVKTDGNNIAPRVGFAWTPSENGKTVVRGGYGIYYGQINAQIANLPATLDGIQIAQAAITAQALPGLNNPLTGRPLTSFDVYQTLRAQGVLGRRTITREDIAQVGLRPGPQSFGRVIFGIASDYVDPYSHQASLEVERAIGDMAFSAGYTFNRGARLTRMLDRNLYYAGRTAADQPVFGFRDPMLLQNNVLESTANSFYHALTLQAGRRFRSHFSLNAHYTFSKAIDEVTDFNSDFEPHDQLNARAERALSSFDQRHRFVASGVVEPGWGLTLSPILSANSGRPFNLLAGFDNLGDRHTTTHRPFGAGRNIGRGPGYVSADLRVSRRFGFGVDGKRYVQFTAEGFNLLNRTNFRTVNNTVGEVRLSDLPQPIAGRRGAPTTPFAFTSAFDPRQFQLGLKIGF
ncbi:MAG: carboxypeptidase regulatory-like domain-containing protein [Bryobacteraceae bacterium]